jgi:hypothetical protein
MKNFRCQPDNWKWKPTNKDIANIWLGFGAMFYVMAFVAFTAPSQTSFTGRWSWLHAIFFNAFGSNGDIVLYSGLGTVSLFFSFLKLKAPK